MTVDFFQQALPGLKHLKPYVPGKPLHEVMQAYGLDDVIKLASNENPLGCSETAKAAAMAALNEVFLYPDGDALALKQALADFYGVARNRITIGNGSNEILELVVRVFAAPGDEVVFSEYSFAVYPLVTQAVGAVPVEVPAADWGCDLDAMAGAIGDKTKVVFIANPNNPTGTWLSADALQAFMQRVPPHVIVVLDEAYFEYARVQPAYSDGLNLQQAFANLVVCRTFSKVYGLAGFRVGYSVSHEQVADLFNRCRQPFNVNAPAQAAAVAALEDQVHVQESVALNSLGLRQCGEAFQRMGLESIPSLANFISVNVGDGGAVYEKLLRQGVIVRPMAGYRMPEYIRVTIGTTEENSRFLDALEKALG